MEKVFHDNEDGTLNVSCTYAPEDYTPVIGKVIDKLVANVTVKGFRKGKAPKDMAMRYLKSEDIYNGMVDKLIDRDFATLLNGYGKIGEVANIKPGLNVNYDQKKKKYNFLYTFVFLPQAEVKDITGLKVEEKAKEVTPADVEAEIGKLLTDNAELVPSKEEAALGDHVTMDFVGYVDGKEFDGGSADDYELTLGSKSFVPGFEDALVGIKEGDRKTIEITFPKDYLASLANKPAKFSVTCKGVKKVVTPAVDDEFASSLTDYKVKTVDELKKAVKEKLEKKAKEDARNDKINRIFDLIGKDAKVVIADNYLELAANQVQENQIGQFKQYGMTLEEYLKVAGTTIEAFKESCKGMARKEAVKFALIKGVAAKAKLAVTDDELAERFGGKEKFASLMKTAAEQHKKNPDFNVGAYLDSVREQIMQEKVNAYLYANN